MSITATLTLGFGLAMDAFAAAIGQGTVTPKAQRMAQALSVGLVFGLAQCVMPLVGWGLGLAFKDAFAAVDHWVAFLLLGFLGIRMIRASLHAHARPTFARGWPLFMLAVATSIDAAAAGVTLALLPLPVWISCALIGLITFVLSVGGVLAGKMAGEKAGNLAGVIGGVVLIGLGTKIFIEHVFFG